MRFGMVERDRSGTRFVLASVIVAAVAAGAVAVMEFRSPSARHDRAAPAAGPYVLAETDRRAIVRLHDAGKDIPWHRRGKLVRRTAPALAQWIRTMEQRLGAAGAKKIPAALSERLALSFQAHELMRARFVVDPGAIEEARAAGYHFGRPSAISFGRVIVFRDGAAAASEAEWVRQLAVLRTYHRRGRPERFAAIYLHGWRPIDRAATRLVVRHGQAVAAVYGDDAKAVAGHVAGK